MDTEDNTGSNEPVQGGGNLRIGRITSINPETFRCNVEYPGTYSSSRGVIATPSPLIGSIPYVGSLVAIYDGGSYGSKRVLSVLESPDGREPSEVIRRQTKAGTIPNMEEGDIFIGHRGRAYFSNNGNVTLDAQGGRANIELNCEKGRAKVDAYNFELCTPGKNVRIRSVSTVSVGPLQTWGDSLHLEVNTPLSSATPESVAEAIPTNLGSFNIDKFGSVLIDVLPLGGVLNSSLSMKVSGVIELVKGFPIPSVGLTITTTDRTKLFNSSGYLSMAGTGANLGEVELKSDVGACKLNLSPIGEVLLLNPLSSIKLDQAGKISLSGSAAILDIESNGSFNAYSSPSPTWNFQISSDGNLSFAGKSVDMLVPSTVSLSGSISTLTGAVTANLVAPKINLGATPAGNVAIGQLLLAILTKMAEFEAKVQTHSHNLIGLVASGLGAGGTVTGLATPSLNIGVAPPAPVLNEIASQNVTVQA